MSWLVDLVEKRISPWPPTPGAPYRKWIGQLTAVGVGGLLVTAWDVYKLVYRGSVFAWIVVGPMTLVLLAVDVFVLLMAAVWWRKLRELRFLDELRRRR